MKNLLYLLLLISCAASADFFFVDNVADFRQALIDASNNSEHDTINVAPGHYKISGGTLLYAPGSGRDFGDDASGLTIQGEDANSTVLDGMDLVTPLTIRYIDFNLAGPVEIRDLKFINGKGNNGGGLSIVKGRDITITNSHFFNNTAQGNGGGIYFFDLGERPTVTLADNQFVKNKASGLGGGFHYDTSDGIFSTSTVTDNKFFLNQAGKSGGGISLSGFEINSTLISNKFIENKAGESGGGLYIGAGMSSCVVANNQFFLNASGRNGGGAVVASFSGFVSVTANFFHNNRAGASGGGLWADGEFETIVNNNKFIDNRAVLDGGGSHVYGDEGGVSFYNNILDSNSTGRKGGGFTVLRKRQLST
jgi:hypothetical protein